MQSNKEKDELIENLQKEVIFDFTSLHLFEIYLSPVVFNPFNSHGTRRLYPNGDYGVFDTV